MANYFLQMQQPRARNSLLDFSPINNGINAIGEAQQQQTRNAMMQQQMDMQREQHASQQARYAKQDARADRADLGKAVLGVHNMPAGPQQDAAWQRVLGRFNVQGLSEQERNLKTGLPMLMAELGVTPDPMAGEERRLGMDLKRAQIEQARAQIEQGRGGKTGLVPIYGTDADGRPVVMQASPTGELVRSRLPEGVMPLGPGGTAESREMGKARGDARANLPKAIETAGEMLSLVRGLKNDDYLPQMVGPIAGRTPDLTSDAGRVVSKMDQIKGSTFLSAYERLKGGGQITEIEGKKAEEAIARLKRTQSYADYIEALTDLERVVMNGLTRARAQAGEVPQEALSQLYNFGAPQTAPAGQWSIKRID